MINEYLKYVSSNIISFGDKNIIGYFVFLITLPININPYIQNILLLGVRDLYEQYISFQTRNSTGENKLAHVLLSTN